MKYKIDSTSVNVSTTAERALDAPRWYYVEAGIIIPFSIDLESIYSLIQPEGESGNSGWHSFWAKMEDTAHEAGMATRDAVKRAIVESFDRPLGDDAALEGASDDLDQNISLNLTEDSPDFYEWHPGKANPSLFTLSIVFSQAIGVSVEGGAPGYNEGWYDSKAADLTEYMALAISSALAELELENAIPSSSGIEVKVSSSPRGM